MTVTWTISLITHFSAALALSTLLMPAAGCGADGAEVATPLTLLYTGAVGGKVEPCG